MARINLSVNGATSLRSSVTHAETGVTWNFANPVPVGEYFNGDIYVVADGIDVEITSITPAAEFGFFGKPDRWINGTVVQPLKTLSGPSCNGFDSGTIYNSYVSSLNKDPGFTSEPLVILDSEYPNGASIVKAVSLIDLSDRRDRSYIDKFCVLTIAKVAPPDNAFRPPVVGDDKRSYYTTSDLDFSKLQSLAPVSGQHAATSKDWFKVGTMVSWNAGRTDVRDFHPDAYRKGYMPYHLEEDILPAMMSLHSNVSNAVKFNTYAGLVQMGIDYAGYNNFTNEWLSNSTHIETFPLVISIAAVALGQPTSLVNAARLDRGSGQNWFYVPNSLVGDTSYFTSTSSETPSFAVYQPVHEGWPEWRIDTDYMNPSLFVEYRAINSNDVPIMALLVDMMGDGEGRTVLDMPQWFDYAKRLGSIFDVSQSALRKPGHSENTLWQTWRQTYQGNATYSALSIEPEEPDEFAFNVTGSDVAWSISGNQLPGSSPITRTDIRYSTDQSTWTQVNDVGSSGTVTDLSPGLYYFQARFHNSVGAGPWSENRFKSNNTNTTARLNTAGYPLTPTYKDALKALWDGSAGSSWHSLIVQEITSTVIVP